MRTWHTSVWMEKSTAVIQRIIQKERPDAFRQTVHWSLLGCTSWIARGVFQKSVHWSFSKEGAHMTWFFYRVHMCTLESRGQSWEQQRSTETEKILSWVLSEKWRESILKFTLYVKISKNAKYMTKYCKMYSKCKTVKCAVHDQVWYMQTC